MNLTSLFRRWGAGLLAAALLGSAVPALAVESEDTGSLFQPDSSQQVTAYAPDERVRIVIELEDAPLLDSHKVCGIHTAKGSFEVEPDGSAHLGWSGVGQDKDLANPCALMTLMGGIAREGEAVVPKLVAKESVTGTALPAAFPDGKETYSVFSQSTCQRLKAMMRNNVTSQYGQSQFGDLAVCAKSGTAEVGSGEPHAWFTGFIDDPDHPLAFVVLVEHGGGGAKVAGSIAAKVLLQATAE